MITLITGAPGAGKTATVVDLLRGEYAGRAVFVDGIPELVVPHVDLADARAWPDSVPDGSLVVIDEVQRIWRPRGPGQKTPADVSALETHRHRGLDFIIVTQQPRLVDANVRALVGRHIHLRDVGILGRWWYEWPECSETVSWKTAPLKRKYKLPKRVFADYKSASMHVKPVRGVPATVLVAVVAVAGAGGLGWYAYQRIATRMHPGGVASARSGVAPALSANASVSKPVDRVQYPKDRFDLLRQFEPRITQLPNSAPAYDGLRRVVAMPRIVAGVCDGDQCRCLTQQGTDSGLASSECLEWVRHRPFDPFKPDPAEQPDARDRAVPPEPQVGPAASESSPGA